MNPTPLTFQTFSDTNRARAEEWCGRAGEESSLEFAGLELAGETGELCNLLKKASRFARGMAGGQLNEAAIADEIADVIICADLVAKHFDLDLGQIIARKFNQTSAKHGFSTYLPEERR